MPGFPDASFLFSKGLFPSAEWSLSLLQKPDVSGFGSIGSGNMQIVI